MQFNENQMRRRNFQQDLSYLNEVSLLLLICWFEVFLKQVILLELCNGYSGVNIWIFVKHHADLVLIPAAANTPRLMLCSLCLLLSLIIQVTSPAKSG